MRIRVAASLAAITCAGTFGAAVTNCVSSSSNPTGPGVDAALAEDGASPSLDGAVDSSAPDAAHDATVLDAGSDSSDATAPADANATDAADAADATFDAADASPSCGPQGITGFVAPPFAVGSILETICDQGSDFSTLPAECFSDASTFQSCNGFPEAGDDGGPVPPACLACLFSPEGDDAGYGAVIQSVVPVLNLAGCVAEWDSSDAGYQCGEAIQAAWECAEYACKPSCPVTDTASRNAYIACTTLAASGVCSAYASAAQACIAVEEEDAGSPTGVQLRCFDGTGPLLDFFCGS